MRDVDRAWRGMSHLRQSNSREIDGNSADDGTREIEILDEVSRRWEGGTWVWCKSRARGKLGRDNLRGPLMLQERASEGLVR